MFAFPPPCGGGGVAATAALVATPLSNSPPQGGREQKERGAITSTSISSSRSHRRRFATSLRAERGEVKKRTASHAHRNQQLRRPLSRLPLEHPGALQSGDRLLRPSRRRHRPAGADLRR